MLQFVSVEIVLDSNAYLVTLSSDNKGEFILSDDQKNYQLALSLSNNTIIAVHCDGVDEVKSVWYIVCYNNTSACSCASKHTPMGISVEMSLLLYTTA